MSVSREIQLALSASDPEDRRRAVSRIAELPASQRMLPLLSALGDIDQDPLRAARIRERRQPEPHPELHDRHDLPTMVGDPRDGGRRVGQLRYGQRIDDLAHVIDLDRVRHITHYEPD